jgi:hypothetical protein
MSNAGARHAFFWNSLIPPRQGIPRPGKNYTVQEKILPMPGGPMHLGRPRSTRTCGAHAGDPGTSPGQGHAPLLRPAGEDRVRTGAAIYSPMVPPRSFRGMTGVIRGWLTDASAQLLRSLTGLSCCSVAMPGPGQHLRAQPACCRGLFYSLKPVSRKAPG